MDDNKKEKVNINLSEDDMERIKNYFKLLYEIDQRTKITEKYVKQHDDSSSEITPTSEKI